MKTGCGRGVIGRGECQLQDFVVPVAFLVFSTILSGCICAFGLPPSIAPKTMLDLHYTDARLVALYEHDNPRGADYDFYLGLAQQLGAGKVVDLGCGTGLLARELAAEGFEVTAADPARAMLEYGQRQPGAQRVEWVLGGAEALGAQGADLLVMTGNVAQVFLTDLDWGRALRRMAKALKPDGMLAFESRNPVVRPWERWTRQNTHHQGQTPLGMVTSWLEVLRADGQSVTFTSHKVFEDHGEHVSWESTLRFRSHRELVVSLKEAGFEVRHTHGGWRREPFAEGRNATMVVVAQRM